MTVSNTLMRSRPSSRSNSAVRRTEIVKQEVVVDLHLDLDRAAEEEVETPQPENLDVGIHPDYKS